MDPIKEAFTKIKDDIVSLKDEISSIRKELSLLQDALSKKENPSLISISPSSHDLTNTQTDSPTHLPTHTSSYTSSDFNEFERFSNQQTNKQTQNMPLEDLKGQNLGISTGNRGVPTNKPTHQQTSQQTQVFTEKALKAQDFNENASDFRKANDMISSLDSLKKEIRMKFKRLTNQEMVVFSTLYTLESEKIEEITYRTLANKLNLSESSIRDYTNKLINKGIPLIKIKQNNKTILLSISSDLKNIATLATIQTLREL